MTATTTSPNMNLPVPNVGVEVGPAWATDINACMSAIDSHDHASGQGVQITPNGLNINAALPMNDQDLTLTRTVRFQSQAAALAAATDIGCLYEVGTDLYYNDGAGNQVRITQSGSVTGATGTITGLPSGTASASFSGGTFTWRSATNTPATMSVGPLVIGAAAVSPKTVTLGASGSQPSDYTLTFPLAAPAANQVPVSDNSGNLSWSFGLLPLGAIVPTMPYLAGAYSPVATTVADARGFVLCNGQTIADATSPMNGAVIPNINNNGAFLRGSTTASGAFGGATTATLTTTELPAHTHTFSSTTTAATTTHTHVMSHYHQWGYISSISSGDLISDLTPAIANDTYTTTGGNVATVISKFTDGAATGASTRLATTTPGNAWYTTGSLGQPNGANPSVAATSTPSAGISVTGTNASTGTGAAFSILPTYIATVFVMRVK